MMVHFIRQKCSASHKTKSLLQTIHIKEGYGLFSHKAHLIKVFKLEFFVQSVAVILYGPTFTQKGV